MTILLSSKTVVYVHIPKTAGFSVSKFFKVPRGKQNHKTLREKTGEFNQIYSFAFLRNPWDRFLSCFNYLKNGGRGGVTDLKNAELLKPVSSFEDFVLNFSKFKDRFSNRHFYPQTHWLDPRLNFVGRFETLDQDFTKLCRELNIPEAKLPRENTSPPIKNFHDFYTPVTKKIVADLYAKEIALLKYGF